MNNPKYVGHPFLEYLATRIPTLELRGFAEGTKTYGNIAHFYVKSPVVSPILYGMQLIAAEDVWDQARSLAIEKRNFTKTEDVFMSPFISGNELNPNVLSLDCATVYPYEQAQVSFLVFGVEKQLTQLRRQALKQEHYTPEEGSMRFCGDAVRSAIAELETLDKRIKTIEGWAEERSRRRA